MPRKKIREERIFADCVRNGSRGVKSRRLGNYKPSISKLGFFIKKIRRAEFPHTRRLARPRFYSAKDKSQVKIAAGIVN